MTVSLTVRSHHPCAAPDPQCDETVQVDQQAGRCCSPRRWVTGSGKGVANTVNTATQLFRHDTWGTSVYTARELAADGRGRRRCFRLLRASHLAIFFALPTLPLPLYNLFRRSTFFALFMFTNKRHEG